MNTKRASSPRLLECLYQFNYYQLGVIYALTMTSFALRYLPTRSIVKTILSRLA